MASVLDRFGRISRKRLVITIWIALYIGLFIDIYVNWASRNYFYIGLRYAYDLNNIISSIAICFFSSFILPRSIKYYSHFFSWIIYFAVFVPSVLVVGMQGYTSFHPAVLNTVLALSFFLIVKIPEVVKFRPIGQTKQVNLRRFYHIFFGFYLLLLSYYLVSFHEVMSFSGLTQIYDQRIRFSEAGTSAFAYYVSGWLSNAMNPYLVGVGLFDRTRFWMVPIGVAGQVAIYMGIAAKIILAALVVTFGFRFFVLVKDRISIERLALGFSALNLLVLLLMLLTSYDPQGLVNEATALLYMRTQAIQGAMTGVYMDFFSANPLTYYSHANIINLLIDYPYSRPLGFVIGTHLVGDQGFNANANFWATDGIAALGLAGVLIIGVVLGLLLSLANRIVTPERLPFTATVSIPFIMSLGNSSLFTNLITGGGLLIAFLVAFGVPSQIRPRRRLHFRYRSSR